ncbi:MAG TPA: amidohydrolase family protein [Spirochaetota bacterium]|nr:amidohydrolase family protein [Spirochaetota bacterium]
MNDVHIHCFQDRAVNFREDYFSDDFFRLLYQSNKASIAGSDYVKDYLINSKTEKAVILSFPWMKDEFLIEQNEYFASVRDQFAEGIHFFGNISFNSRDIERDIESLINLGFSGIGEIAFYDGNVRYDYLDEILYFAGQENLPVNIHLNETVGHNYPGKYFTDFQKLSDILARNADTNVILSHLGGGFLFYFLMPEIRNSLTNVYFDISASPFLYLDDVYRTALLCAPGKILFGTDFPLIGKDRYMKTISGDCARDIDLSTNYFFDHVLTGRMKES